MDSRPISARPDVAFANTSPRVTPTPPRASRFGEVLSNTVVQTAESAMRVLPGSPTMALAVRTATGTANGALSVPMTTMSSTSAQGPLAAGSRSVAPSLGSPLGAGGLAGAAVPGAAGSVAGEAPSIEGSLQQSQDMNLYYLQLQENINAQNRSFTALSNVMKAEHETVKTAIGNIR